MGQIDIAQYDHQHIAVDDSKDEPYIITKLINKIGSEPEKQKMHNPADSTFLGKDNSPIQFAEELTKYDISCAILHEYNNVTTQCK